jgi:fluoride exporter
MQKVLLAGLGGFIGSAARYSIGVALIKASATLSFPLATLLVNVVGSFLIGLLLGLAPTRAWLNVDARVFLVVGVLGGFTTFSSFSNDTLELWREIGAARAALNIFLNVAVCLSAVWLGDAAARTVAR